MKLGEKLLVLRKKEGLSQEGLAERLQVSRQTISNWENDITSPTLQQAKALSKIFKVSLEELCDNDGKEILVEKVSNTERLAGLLIKIMKIMGIILLIYLVVMLIGIGLYRTQISEKGIVNRVESRTSCQVKDETYELSIHFDENNSLQITGDDMMIDLAHKSKSESEDKMIQYIEQYFQKIGGSCQ